MMAVVVAGLCFNSRTLGRVRLYRQGALVELTEFQFTHPGKGATKRQPHLANSISEFQFTHPGKGATWRGFVVPLSHYVSIHAPWEGCDTSGMAWTDNRHMFQFTHPGKGATSSASSCDSTSPRFNSRTLGRVRHPNYSEIKLESLFQFTHPGKGATSPMRCSTTPIRFQFTHPGKGATLQALSPLNSSVQFQFTHPGKGATEVSQADKERILFQFTHPGKGATASERV